MSILDITEAKAKKLEEMETNAIDVITEVLKGKREFGDVEKLGMQAINAVAKNRQTLTSRLGIGFQMITNLTDDKTILEKYVRASTPTIGKLLATKDKN